MTDIKKEANGRELNSLITCKAAAAEILERAKDFWPNWLVRTDESAVDRYLSDNGIPTLAIVSVGNDPASEAYIKGKVNDALACGFAVNLLRFPSTITQGNLNTAVQQLCDPSSNAADGVIVQMPLPGHLSCPVIDKMKDVDGMMIDSPFTPCTAEGIHILLKSLFYDRLSGLHVVIVNRSELVGRPLSTLLLDSDCTVTVCHSHTERLKDIMLSADVVVSAVGNAYMFDDSYIKPGTVVIDVGITRAVCQDCKLHLCGDFEPDLKNAAYQTPVPGGVGLLTRAMLMKHVRDAYYAGGNF